MEAKVQGAGTDNYLEVEGVVGVRHQAVLVGALQLEAVGDHAIGVAVFAVAVEFGQTVAVPQLLEVLVGAVDSAGAEVLHHTWRVEGGGIGRVGWWGRAERYRGKCTTSARLWSSSTTRQDETRRVCSKCFSEQLAQGLLVICHSDITTCG